MPNIPSRPSFYGHTDIKMSLDEQKREKLDCNSIRAFSQDPNLDRNYSIAPRGMSLSEFAP